MTPMHLKPGYYLVSDLGAFLDGCREHVVRPAGASDKQRLFGLIPLIDGASGNAAGENGFTGAASEVFVLVASEQRAVAHRYQDGASLDVVGHGQVDLGGHGISRVLGLHVGRGDAGESIDQADEAAA